MRSHRSNLVLALAIFTLDAFSQTGVPVWTNFYRGLNESESRLHALAIDQAGNVFVSGSSEYSNGLTAAVTISYNSAGVARWTNQYFTGSDRSMVSGVDRIGNIFAGGVSMDELTTIAYSNSGHLLWTNRYFGLRNSSGARALAVGNNGNVFVTGYSSGATAISDDFVTLAYSGSGQPLWTNRFSGTGVDDPRGIAVDDQGNVFVTGASQIAGVDHYATVGYSSGGMPMWTNFYSGSNIYEDEPYAIATDQAGNVFVTGHSTRNLAPNYTDFLTVAYSGSGAKLWTNRYDGPARRSDYARAIAVDRHGNVIVTGKSDNLVGAVDIVTVAYSNSGLALWTNRYASTTDLQESPSAITIDQFGNIIVGGSASPPSGGIRGEMIALAYSSNGIPLWTNRFHPGFGGGATGLLISADPYGNVVAAGDSFKTNTGHGRGWVSIKYGSFVSSPRIDYQDLSGQMVLSWSNAAFGLQSSPTVFGIFTNVEGATSPYTNPTVSGQQFFRLIAR